MRETTLTPIQTIRLPNVERLNEFIAACIVLQLPFEIQFEKFDRAGNGAVYPRFTGIVYKPVGETNVQ